MKNYFVNYNNGQITINAYRTPNAAATDVEDIRNAFANETNEILTASLNDWIAEFGGSLDDDNLERVIEGEFGLKLYDYPELRDIQRDHSDA